MFFGQMYDGERREQVGLSEEDMRKMREERWGADAPPSAEQGAPVDAGGEEHKVKPLNGVGSTPGMFDGFSNVWKGIPAAALQTWSSLNTGLSGIVNPEFMGTTEGAKAFWRKQTEEVMPRAAAEARAYSRENYEPGPEEMGEASMIVHGLFKMLPKAAAYTALAGPAGGALAFGADVGVDTAMQLKDKGVTDEKTLINAGLTSFAMNTIGMRLPAVLGSSRVTSALYGAGVNIGTETAEIKGIKLALENADYKTLAQQYDLGWTELAVSGVFGATLGAALWRSPVQIRQDKINDRALRIEERIKSDLISAGHGADQASVQARLHARGIAALSADMDIDEAEFLPRIASEDGSNGGNAKTSEVWDQKAPLEWEENLAEDAKAWRDLVDKREPNSRSWMNETKQENVPFLRHIPLVMKMIGAPIKSRPLMVRSHVFDGSHPEITPEILKSLPEAIVEPVAIFESAQKTGSRHSNPDSKSYVMMLELRDAKGATVIAPIEVNGFGQRKIVLNFVKTVYSKAKLNGEPRNDWFDEQYKNGRLLYVDEKKLSLWRSFAGSNSHWDLSRGSGGIVKTKPDLVKYRERHGNKFFQEQAGWYDPRAKTIHLTEHANLSTFSHEMSHWYSETIVDFYDNQKLAPEYKGDVDALMRALGMESVAEYRSLDIEGRRKHQEKFASWTEIYLSEGKSPVKGLEGVFARMGQWIRDVYRGAVDKEIGDRYKAEFGSDLPQLSPEVRNVLDRMYGAELKESKIKPSTKQVAAARIMQSQRINNEKITAPLNNGTAPDVYRAASEAQRKATEALNNGEKVDVSAEVRPNMVNEAAVERGQKTFARTFMSGDNGTITVLQNRDRSAIASVGQMNAIAAAPNYGLMSFDRTNGSGAPIVSYGEMPEDRFIGHSDYIVDKNGAEKIPVTYAVVEADSLLRSNNADGSQVAEYGSDPARTHVIAGNGRTAGLVEAYRRGTTSQYVEDLKADAVTHGVDPSAIGELKHPILVRFMPPEHVTSGFVARSNSSQVMEMSAVERAVQDSPKLSRGGIRKYEFDENGNPSADTVRQFVVDIGEPNALGSLLTADGVPNEAAARRIRAAAFFSAYKDAELTELAADAVDKQGVKRILNSMAAFAPHAIEIRERSGGAIDFGPVLAEAVNVIRNANAEGLTGAEFLRQGALFGEVNPAVMQVAEIFDSNRNSAAAINRIMSEFSERVKSSLPYSAGQDSLFGADVAGPTDVASALVALRKVQNEEIRARDPNAELLPEIDEAQVRASLEAVEASKESLNKVLEDIGETVTERGADETSAIEAEASPASVETPAPTRREIKSARDMEVARLETISAQEPERMFMVEDENGQLVRVTADEIFAMQRKIDEQAEIDSRGMEVAAQCIIKNRGIE